MASSVRIDRNVPMKMRDGVVLRADIFRPDDNERHPAIVIRTPYNKLLTARWFGDHMSPVDAAFAGYAVVFQDTRGRFASDGEFTHPMPQGIDGYDTVECVAAEPWCDGNVGMVGGSYLAAVQWEAAMENPPHLKALSPSMSVSGLITPQRVYGGWPLSLMVSWLAGVAVDMIDRLEKQGKDVSKMRKMMEDIQFNTNEVCRYLPLKDLPHFQFEGVSHLFITGWAELDATLAALPSMEGLFWYYDKVKVPCFHSTGWYDIFLGSTFHNFQSMRKQGGSKRAREGQHFLCGPWAHWTSLPSFAGGIHFGPVASSINALLSESKIAFFDKYLRGIDVKIPAIRYFVMGRDRWENADAWPLPQTQWQRFFLHSKGRANTAAGDGLLSRNAPASEPPDMFVYDPRFPVPTLGGKLLATGRLAPGPLDHTPIEKRNDVLCYTTPGLDQDIEVTGPIVLHLFAGTSVKDTDFMAKLVDVYPDGSSYSMAEGYIRTRYRNSVIHPELINPGEVNEYSIDMEGTSVLFRRGHRIRIDITSSNFPEIDRNMNTGNSFGQDAEGMPAIQTIYHEASYSSYIDLPVIPPAR